MEAKYKYQVIEDSGGGLSLYIWRGRKVIYAHSGYETNRGQLTQDMNALDEGANVAQWEGCEENPQGDYDNMTSSEYGWQIVATGGGGKRKLYPGRMGVAAKLEFEVTEEEHARAQGAALLGSAKSDRKAAAVRTNGLKGGRPTLKRKQAETRINEMEFTADQAEFIWSDWPNMTEHIDWLLTASREEISDWIDAANNYHD